jgi:DNA-binding NtrC family response regulator
VGTNDGWRKRNKKMNYRVLIFDDEKGIRQMLWLLFDNRGYEVFTFPNPTLCPISKEEVCPCGDEKACSDIILSDVNMPVKNGLEFLEEQIKKGCKCNHIALMSGAFTDESVFKAKSLGVKIFKKPFKITEIINWLDQIAKDIDPERKLSDWFLKGIPENSED